MKIIIELSRDGRLSNIELAKRPGINVIIKEIVDNAEATHGELAEKLGVNQSTITRRISSLVKQNVIKMLAARARHIIY